MKKALIIASLFFFIGNIAAQSEVFDVNILNAQIMEKLSLSLNLNDGQKQQVNSAVKEFLTQKADILPLQSTDPSSYSSKFNMLNGSLIGKLKTILMAKQMTSFLSMKPKTNDPKNVLSHIFY